MSERIEYIGRRDEKSDEAENERMQHKVHTEVIDDLEKQLQGCATLVELGCGSGAIATRMVGAGHHVTGFDQGKSAISAAEAYALQQLGGNWPRQVNFYVGDVTADNFPPLDFPLCEGGYSTFLLEYLPLEKRQALYRNLRKCIKPGGLFVAMDLSNNLVLDPMPAGALGEAYSTGMRVLAKTGFDQNIGLTLANELQKAGYTVIHDSGPVIYHDFQGIPKDRWFNWGPKVETLAVALEKAGYQKLATVIRNEARAYLQSADCRVHSYRHTVTVRI